MATSGTLRALCRAARRLSTRLASRRVLTWQIEAIRKRAKDNLRFAGLAGKGAMLRGLTKGDLNS